MGKKENVVREKSFAFAMRIVETYRLLVKTKKEFVIAKQMLRSGTSIGANVEEADNAISKADFSSKISIAYKEAKETHYWLRLLTLTGYLEGNLSNAILNDCEELCRLLCSILKTSRGFNPNQQ